MTPSKTRMPRWVVPALALTGLAATAALVAPGAMQVGVQDDGSVLVPTNQILTPVGLSVRVPGSRPKDMALSPDGKAVAVLATNRLFLFSVTGESLGDAGVRGGAIGVAWAPDGKTIYASGTDGKLYRVRQDGEKWAAEGVDLPDMPEFPIPGGRRGENPQPNGLVVSPGGDRLYVAVGKRNAVAVLGLPEMKLLRGVGVGVAPYHVTLTPDGKTLYVSNRGGRQVPAGPDTQTSAGTPVKMLRDVDSPARGSVSAIDTGTFAAREVDCPRQPSGIALSPDGKTAYVTSSDDDSVAVLDTAALQVRGAFTIRPPEDPGFGQIPTDAAVSGDGNTLYVACGGGNAVAVVDIRRRPELEGYLPAAWYPAALVEKDGRLIVACSKGIGARPENTRRFGVHASVGAVQFITREDRKDLRRLTRQVAANNRWGQEPETRPNQPARPIPQRVGEPSVFKHVVYIIKENHTYDMVLGDMPGGNGEKSLNIFPEEVTPNQHEIARQWVLLDNTYTSGTNSADGHQWTASAVANAYIEQNYNAHSRSYPYDGGDALAYSPEGFLWNAAVKKGRSVRVYGEFVNRPKVVDPANGRTPTWTQLWEDYKAGGNKYEITADTDQATLKPLIHPNFIGFPMIVSDQWRADQFLKDLKGWETSGQMPNLSIMLLPNDHTSGTRAGMPTPRAMTADNDLAVGRIVEAISRSRFWKETLILVIEDDSQMGLDHVDGHRTIAFCISPYTRRGAVISEPYNHTSMIRTMGLVLGLPALNRFDRSATPLTACFTETPDFRPFTHRPNRIPLDEMNPRPSALQGEAKKLALACERLNWEDVDLADASTVARSVWLSQRPGVPFPWQHFHPNEDDDDEEETEEEERKEREERRTRRAQAD